MTACVAVAEAEVRQVLGQRQDFAKAAISATAAVTPAGGRG